MPLHTVVTLLLVSLLFGCGVRAQNAPPQHASHAAPLLGQMHLMNELVVRASSFAADRAQNPLVVAYAKRLREDHQFADHRLHTLASRVGVNLPTASSAIEQRLATWRNESASQRAALGDQERLQAMAQLNDDVAHLQHMQGPDVDLQFVRIMRNALREAVADVSADKPLSEPPLRGALSKQLPILEQQLTLARSLQARLEV